MGGNRERMELETKEKGNGRSNSRRKKRGQDSHHFDPLAIASTVIGVTESRSE
jgi:hypothetical protein